MLSILIPTYNYNTYPLVLNLHQQATKLEIDFEIIVMDDCSTETIKENGLLDNLSNAMFIKLSENLGRSAIRNKLASIAKHNWLLFLDADVMPISNNFLRKYIDTIQNHDVVFGGISYEPNTTEKSSLRLKYGLERESISLNSRLELPYSSFTSANFILKREIFNRFGFKELYKTYGYEDTLFAFDLKENNIKINHIDNPVFHLGVESNPVFLNKSLESLQTLSYLMNNDFLDPSHTSITRTFKLISKLSLSPLFGLIYKKLKPKFEKHLLSAKPNLTIFDLYRLCYLCHLEKK